MRRATALVPVLAVVVGAMLAPAAGAAPLRLVAAELPPYTFQVPPATVAEFPGPGQGIVHEVAEALARRVGQPAVIEYLPWPEAQRLAQSREPVAILSLTRTPEREAQYRWVSKIVDDELVLVGRKGTDVSSLDAVRARPVGVLSRSGAEALLREGRFPRIVPAAEEWVNARRLRDGQVDAWLAPRMMVLHAWREVGGDPGGLALGAAVRPSEIWLAMSKAVPEAEAQRWAQAFEAMRSDGSYARILAKYERLEVKPVPDDMRREMSGPLWAFPF